MFKAVKIKKINKTPKGGKEGNELVLDQTEKVIEEKLSNVNFLDAFH